MHTQDQYNVEITDIAYKHYQEGAQKQKKHENFLSTSSRMAWKYVGIPVAYPAVVLSAAYGIANLIDYNIKLFPNAALALACGLYYGVEKTWPLIHKKEYYRGETAEQINLRMLDEMKSDHENIQKGLETNDKEDITKQMSRAQLASSYLIFDGKFNATKEEFSSMMKEVSAYDEESIAKLPLSIRVMAYRYAS